MSVNSKMTAIADAIRELSGTTDTMGLDAMATHIGDANDEVDSQVELLAQAVAALEGKAGGGSGGATCSVTIDASVMNIPLLLIVPYYVKPDGTVSNEDAITASLGLVQTYEVQSGLFVLHDGFTTGIFGDYNPVITGGVNAIITNPFCMVFQVSGDGTITFNH